MTRGCREPAWWAKARELRADGLKYADVARACGKSLCSVYRACNTELVRAQQRARWHGTMPPFKRGWAA